MTRNLGILLGFFFLFVSQNSLQLNGQEASKSPVRVFVLAGQSNMQGHAVVDLDHPEYYNGGKGTLESVMNKAANKELMAHLKDKQGNWTVRDDVFCWYQTEKELKTGGISIGFAAYGGAPHHFGPEMQFGHVLGDAFEEPVLLIKTAWGGKSLHTDFRSPSSGGTVGPYYVKMLEQVGVAMEQAPIKFPILKGRELKITGFVWQQGWNDMIDETATAEYATNLKNFIVDIRKQLGVPGLPFVYGELGNGGETKGEKMQQFRAAQAAVAAMKIPNVAFVPTAPFARPPEDSPNKGHLHHWFGNAESYFLVGDALGKAMVSLLAPPPKARVLILGDSISIGYTPFVKSMMAEEAIVFRPMRNKNAAENCAGTDNGITNIDRWLMIEGGNWDVIHFNFGLHDLKHVNAETGGNSNDPKDPLQSDPKDYEKQLREIVGKLKKTDAKLILCTTTPVPEGCKPLRETTAPGVYNAIAIKIANENDIQVNDLFSFANSQLEKIQRPENVHFTKQGSEILAEQVVSAIRMALKLK